MKNNTRPSYFYTTRRWIDIVSILIPLVYTLALIIKHSSFNYLTSIGLMLLPFLWLGLRALHAITMDTAIRSRIKLMRANEFEVKFILIIQVAFIFGLVLYKAYLFWFDPFSIPPHALLPYLMSIFIIAILCAFSYPVLLIGIKLLCTVIGITKRSTTQG